MLSSFVFHLSSAPKPGPSFQSPVLPAPVPVDVYIQGNPIFTLNGQYFIVPQVSVSVYSGPSFIAGVKF